MKKKTKKKAAKKPASKSKPRPVPAGARDVGFRERKLREAVAETRALVVDDGEGGTAPVLCDRPGCFVAAVDWIDEVPYCEEHIPAEIADYVPAGALTAEAVAEILVSEQVHADAPPHIVGEPSTHEEILASDNAVIRDRYIASLPRPPERHVYVPPPPGPRPELPVLQPHLLEFHTTRQGLLCDVAFTIFSDVVIMRVHDRLSGGSTYSLAGVADLYTEQYGGEVASHYWHFATDEEHAALAACDPDEPPAASERISA